MKHVTDKQIVDKIRYYLSDYALDKTDGQVVDAIWSYLSDYVLSKQSENYWNYFLERHQFRQNATLNIHEAIKLAKDKIHIPA
ncbi:MAG: hypothetical protein LBG95_06980 [Treponema sp.]|jgi:hypothetical protein|nr:hypothetical protein [Treponema sp.]